MDILDLTFTLLLDIQVMSASQPAPYSTREEPLIKKLRRFSEEYVKIPKDDMDRSRELVTSYIEKQVIEYCRQESTALPILRLEYTGSVYEGLKTEAADEVDVMVVLGTCQDFNVKDSEIPGYVRLMAGTDSQFRKYLSPEGYIVPELLRNGWFTSRVAKAVNAFNNTYNSDVRLKMRYHGPAIQIDIHCRRTGEKLLSTDLVLCFTAIGHSTECDYYVAKPFSLGRARRKTKLLWRRSFSLKEKAVLQHMDRDGGCRHELLRIVKTLVRRPRASLGKLTSYHLKTAFMHYMEENPNNWDGENSLEEHFLGFLREVRMYLEKSYLPHYWLPSINLFENIRPVVVAHMTARVKSLLRRKSKMNKLLECPG